jgi:NAD(P)H dehydrogenase (quinone)
MNSSIILGHPTKDSFNHTIAEAVRDVLGENGMRIYFHDLYAEAFNPVLPGGEILKGGTVPLDIQHYCDEIAVSDIIVIVHPNWWGQPPAILKGWVDRVLRTGVAYKFQEKDNGEGVPIGLLKAKAAVVFNTSNTPLERERTIFGDPLEQLWNNCIFDLCGVRNFYRKMYSVMCTSTPEQREAWLKDVRHVITAAISEKV